MGSDPVLCGDNCKSRVPVGSSAVAKGDHPFPGRASLENLSGDSNREYFAEGMTYELITELASNPNVRVVSRTSVMQEKEAGSRCGRSHASWMWMR
jgi:TolB-like protein